MKKEKKNYNENRKISGCQSLGQGIKGGKIGRIKIIFRAVKLFHKML